MTNSTLLEVAKIRTDGGTQNRVQMDWTIITDYAEAMQRGDQFPPIAVFFDGSDYWLADGFHRIEAATAAGVESLSTEIKNGSLEDAQWYSIGANKYHGLRRSNEDKAQAVIAALKHPNGSRLSDRQIAEHIGVSHATVIKYRSELEISGQIDQIDQRTVTRNGTTYTIDTSNIGQKFSGYNNPLHRPTLPSTFGQIDFDSPQLQEAERIFGSMAPTTWPPATLTSLIPEEDEEETRREHNRNILSASNNNEWYTPPAILEAAHELMGGIDLDPASNSIANQTVKATQFYTIHDDGYTKQWRGRVFMNPPYGRHAEGESNQARWTEKLISEFRVGNVTEAVCLVNAVPGNQWFAPLWDFPICFPNRRTRFYGPDGEIGNPTYSNALIYFGPQVAKFVRIFSRFGPVAGQLIEHSNRVLLHGNLIAGNYG